MLLEDGQSAAREAAVSLLQDQGSYLTHLNIIRCMSSSLCGYDIHSMCIISLLL